MGAYNVPLYEVFPKLLDCQFDSIFDYVWRIERFYAILEIYLSFQLESMLCYQKLVFSFIYQHKKTMLTLTAIFKITKHHMIVKWVSAVVSVIFGWKKVWVEMIRKRFLLAWKLKKKSCSGPNSERYFYPWSPLGRKLVAIS